MRMKNLMFALPSSIWPKGWTTNGHGRVRFAEGKKGGQFYTPRSVAELLVEILEPYKGRVFDPCCGSGGMFVQSEKFVAGHQVKPTIFQSMGRKATRPPGGWQR